MLKKIVIFIILSLSVYLYAGGPLYYSGMVRYGSAKSMGISLKEDAAVCIMTLKDKTIIQIMPSENVNTDKLKSLNNKYASVSVIDFVHGITDEIKAVRIYDDYDYWDIDLSDNSGKKPYYCISSGKSLFFLDDAGRIINNLTYRYEQMLFIGQPVIDKKNGILYYYAADESDKEALKDNPWSKNDGTLPSRILSFDIEKKTVKTVIGPSVYPDNVKKGDITDIGSWGIYNSYKVMPLAVDQNGKFLIFTKNACIYSYEISTGKIIKLSDGSPYSAYAYGEFLYLAFPGWEWGNADIYRMSEGKLKILEDESLKFSWYNIFYYGMIDFLNNNCILIRETGEKNEISAYGIKEKKKIVLNSMNDYEYRLTVRSGKIYQLIKEEEIYSLYRLDINGNKTKIFQLKKHNFDPGSYLYDDEKKLFFYKYGDSLLCLFDAAKNTYTLVSSDCGNLPEQISRENKIVLSSTAKGLRLREKQGLNAAVIRTLGNEEKLEVLEWGALENIDGIIGQWVKVKTVKGETGWCFSGYLY